MATLYRDPDWSSKNLEAAILEARRHVVKDKMPALFPDQLHRYKKELRQRSQEGYKVTFTDFWGLLIEACLGDEVGTQLLLDRTLTCLLSSSLPHQGVWQQEEVKLDLQMHLCTVKGVRCPNV